VLCGRISTVVSPLLTCSTSTTPTCSEPISPSSHDIEDVDLQNPPDPNRRSRPSSRRSHRVRPRLHRQNARQRRSPGQSPLHRCLSKRFVAIRPPKIHLLIPYTNQLPGLHTAAGTAFSATGSPITEIKLPYISGHEGIARIVALGPGLSQHDPSIRLGALVGIRFNSRTCRRCTACLAGREQYCSGDGIRSLKPTNHVHHEDGSFQEYVCLDAGYLTILPQDVDPILAAPTLCAGVTAYKAVMQAELKPSSWLVVLGAGGGFGHYAVQYGLLWTPFVVGVDAGKEKGELVRGFGAEFVDYKATPDLRAAIDELTDGRSADAVIVAARSSATFATAASL
jgi:hypothetical protein